MIECDAAKVYVVISFDTGRQDHFAVDNSFVADLFPENTLRIHV
jgi:hypothetical protein